MGNCGRRVIGYAVRELTVIYMVRYEGSADDLHIYMRITKLCVSLICHANLAGCATVYFYRLVFAVVVG